MKNGNLEEKLFFYLQEHCRSTDDVLSDVIARSSIRMLLHQFTENADNLSQIKKEEQFIKRKNDLFIKDIVLFARLSQLKGLEPIFLKGLVLAYVNEQDMNQRTAKDVDVLIDKEKVKQYCSVFNQMGYVIVETNEYKQTKDLEKVIERNHLVFAKHVENLELVFEVHATIVNPPFLFRDTTRVFQKNKKCILFFEQPLYVLTNEYNFIYLIMHLYKHCPRTFHYFMFEKGTQIKLYNLNEIAHFVEKNKLQMDWELVYSIAEQMETVMFVYTISKWVNEIYGEIIPNGFLRKCYHNREYSYMNISSESGMGNYSWLFDYVIRAEKLSFKEFLAGKFLENQLDYLEIIKEKETQKGGEFPFYKGCVFAYEGGKLRIDTKVWIDEEGIRISIFICGKQLSAYGGVGKKEECDGFNLILVTGRRIICRNFIASRDDCGVHLWIYEKEHEDRPIRYIESELTVREDEISMVANVTWEALDFDPKKESFACGGSVFISDPYKQCSIHRCNLFSEKRDANIWDFRESQLFCR